MKITQKQLIKYLEDNANKTTYLMAKGSPFTFELIKPGKKINQFPYTIVFRSPIWSNSTVRRNPGVLVFWSDLEVSSPFDLLSARLNLISAIFPASP